MRTPSPEHLRAELRSEKLPPGAHEPSVIQFGCDGCPYGHRFVAGWLSESKLVQMIDGEQDVPRAFVSGNMSAIGKAAACELDPQTQEPDCQHVESLTTVVQRTNPFPEI